MKFKIIYHEVMQKEFRSKKSLEVFLNKHLDSEILRVVEYKHGTAYMCEIRQFLKDYKYES